MARRVNTKFLILLTLVVGGLVVGVFAAQKFLNNKDPAELLRSAEQNVAAGKLQAAVFDLRGAINADPGNPATRVQLGDVHVMMKREDADWQKNAFSAWGSALQVDPKYVPALERLIRWNRQRVEAFPRAAVGFTELQEFARRLREAQPDNLEAAGLEHRAVIEMWLNNHVVPDEDVAKAMDGLAALVERDPTSAEHPYWLARAQMQRARDRDAQTQRTVRDEALGLMAAAVAKRPDDARMHWRMGQLHALALGTEPDRAGREKRLALIGESLNKARELAKADQPEYPQIMMGAAQFALQRNDTESSAKTMQALVDARPWDQGLRIRQARLLASDPRRIDDAIRILEQPAPPREGIDWDNLLLDYEDHRQLELLQLRTRRLQTIADGEERRKQAEQIEKDRQALALRLGEQPELMELKGDLHLARRQLPDAVAAFEQARTAMQGRGVNPDLLAKLASVYADLGQSGSAKALWTDVLRVHADHVPTRLRLADTLLRENDVVGAERQLKALEEQGVAAEQLSGLRAALAARKQDPKATATAFKDIPEETRDQMLRKAVFALQLNNRGEAIRLLEAARKIEPAPELLEDLVRLYVTEKQSDKAQATVAELAAQYPDRPSLPMLQAAVNQANPEEVERIQREAIEKIQDPFRKELALFELARQRNRLDEALRHLQAAEQLKPDDVSVKERMLSVTLQQQDWAKAERYVDQLAAGNHDQANGAVYRFELARARGEVDKAARFAEEASGKLQHFAKGPLILGQARFMQGRYDEAITQFRSAVEKQANNADALRGLLQCHYALGNASAAEAVIGEARRVLPADPTFIEAELEHKQRFGDPAEVLAARRAAAEQNPDSAAHAIELGQAYAQAARYARERRNDERRSTEHLRAALQVFQNAAKKWPDDLRFVASIAEVQLALGDAAAAEKTIRDVGQKDAWRDRAEPHLMMAELMARSGRRADAEGQLREALIKSQHNPQVRLQLVDFLAQTGRLDLALEELDQADRKNPIVQRKRVELLLVGNAVKEGEEALKEAIATSPDEPDLKSTLASLYLATNRMDDAKRTVDEVLGRHPENLTALLTRGRLRLVQGAVDEAIADLSRVTAARKGNVEAQVALAQAFARKGNIDASLDALQTALAAQPLNKPLRLQTLTQMTNAQPPRWIEAERLLRDTRQMPQYEKDADWPLVEAQMWRQREQPARALASVQEARKLAPENPVVLATYFETLVAAREYQRVLTESEPLAKAQQPAWWVHHVRALAHKGKGDKSAALAEYERALATNDATQDSNVKAQLIQSLANQIGVDDAIGRIGDKIRTEPAWQLLALQLYQTAGRSAEAISLLQQMEPDKAKLPEAQRRQFLQLSALVYTTAKPLPEPAKAHDAYLALLEMNGNDVQALNNLACLLVDTMRPADPVNAVKYSQKAMDLMAQRGRVEPVIQDTHGWVLTHLPNRMAEGISLLEQVVASRPKDLPDAYYHLGDAYLRDNQPQRAIDPLKTAQELLASIERDGRAVDSDLKAKVMTALSEAQAKVSASAQ